MEPLIDGEQMLASAPLAPSCKMEQVPQADFYWKRDNQWGRVLRAPEADWIRIAKDIKPRRLFLLAMGELFGRAGLLYDAEHCHGEAESNLESVAMGVFYFSRMTHVSREYSTIPSCHLSNLNIVSTGSSSTQTRWRSNSKFSSSSVVSTESLHDGKSAVNDRDYFRCVVTHHIGSALECAHVLPKNTKSEVMTSMGS